MTRVLPDVNLLLAVGWVTHEEHRRAKIWLSKLSSYATCPLTELGFLRVSMSPGYRAKYTAAMAVLDALKGRESASFISADLEATAIPAVDRFGDTTDAYLVALAEKHGCRLATLDEGILAAEWSADIAFHPFVERRV